MNRLRIAVRSLAVVSLLVALGGCELFKRNDEVAATVNRRAVGMAVGEFFDRYGRPASSRPAADGGVSYEWVSSVPYARAGPEGLDEHVCKMRLTATREGRITGAQIQFDAPGLKSTSRCGEIFAAP